MRAAIRERYGEPRHPRNRLSEPDEDGVVVRAEACGICRSDWHAWQGHDVLVSETNEGP